MLGGERLWLLVKLSFFLVSLLVENLVDSTNLALSRPLSSSTRDKRYCLLPINLPSLPMLTLNNYIHSIRLVGSFVNNLLSNLFVYSVTGYLLEN